MAALASDAAALLEAVRQFGVTGLSIPNPDDPSTWTFHPAELSPDQIAAATAALVALLVPPAPPAVLVSKLAFLRLLLPGEWAAFTTGAETDPMLKYAMALLDAAVYLTPTEPTFVQMVTYCVAVGVFTQERAAALVAGMQA